MASKADKREQQRNAVAARTDGAPRKRGRPPGVKNRPREAPPAAPQLQAGQGARIPEGAIKGGACSCGEPFKDGQKFCGKCGKHVRGNVCRHCEAAIPGGSLFCASCGKPRETEPAAAAPPAAGAPPPLEALQGKPAAIPAQQPGQAAPALAASPAVGAPVFLPAFSIEMFFDVVDEELVHYLDSRPLKDDEKQKLAEVWANVVNSRARATGPNADIWAAALTTVFVFGPRTFAAWIWHRRQQRAEQQKKIGDGARPSTAIAASPGTEAKA